jgi:acetyl-CoA C-acetyltransferase
VYSTEPAAWAPDSSADLQAEVDGWDAPAQARQADGVAVIETFTVTRARDGAAAGIVIGRLEAGGERFAARAADGDREMLDLLTTADQPIGQRVYVRSAESGNVVSITG